jgi:hypothetical protein
MVKALSWDTVPGEPAGEEELPIGVLLEDLIPSAPMDDSPRVTIGESVGINPTRVRAKEAHRLRQQGLTYREIGERLGRTREYCRQLVLKAERIIASAHKHGQEPLW